MDNHIRQQELDWSEYTRCARQAAADGIVLLKNDGAVLPFPEGTRISLFGVSQLLYYKSGTGSGGMVNVSHVTSIREALDDDRTILLNHSLMHLYDRYVDEHPFRTGEGWGNDPWSQEEMPLTDEICQGASAQSDAAVVIIGRTAGEDRDSTDEEGSYRLTQREMDMLRRVRAAFDRMVVLLNTGSIIDMSFVEEISPDSVLLVWQGGMVGGLGVADVLTGEVNPSGHLTDTIARSLQDYPSAGNFGTGTEDLYQEDIYVGYRFFETVARESVLYPFGFGLSYTTFDIHAEKIRQELGRRLTVDLKVTVTNTGSTDGREVVQVYAACPQGELGKPARILVDFAKTKLLEPDESETITFRIPVRRFASFDDTGVTGDLACWTLEEGRYDLYVGDNVRDAERVESKDGAFSLTENWPVLQEEEAMAPVRQFDRMVVKENEDGSLHIGYDAVRTRTVDRFKRIYENLPDEITPTGDQGYRLSDVEEGNVSMEDFIAQLSDRDLAAIVRGEGMGSPLVTQGTAAAFGGSTKRLREFGIPAVCCDDGPSGMRLDCGDHAFSLPGGTMLACTWDRELNEKLFSFLGREMVKNRVDCILGPGINIHRNPLNGRNFEYFSEDPFVTGQIAAAQLRGLHSEGVTGVIKHFCANNRETRRHEMDSIVSERALREIYLRGFEIAVHEGRADAVMTSYGRVNGTHTSSLYDLTTMVLRDDWGFEGIVMTDWWALMSSFSDEGEIIEDTEDQVRRKMMAGFAGRVYDFSAMVRAQNDLYMVVPDGEKIEPWQDAQGPEDRAGSVHRAQDGGAEHAPAEAGLPEERSGSTLDALARGRITRGELQRCAMNICRFAMRTEAMRRLQHAGTQIEVTNAPEDEDVDAVEPVTFLEVPGEGLSVDLSGADTDRGEDFQFGVQMQAGGTYRFELTASCDGPQLAQIPVTLFISSIPVVTLTWTGTGGEDVLKGVDYTASTRSNVVRIHFGQSGLELKELKISALRQADRI